MIAAALILGALAIVGTTLVAKYFNKILDFLKKVTLKLKAKISGTLMGSCVFIRKLGRKFQNRTKHYSKDEMMRWKETTVVYEMEEEEVPEEYRQYAKEYEDYDVTDDLAMQLKQA